MSVIGVGKDICHISRIEDVLAKNADKFISRLLSSSEIEKAFSKDKNFIARRFAAKEAVAKALGTGIGNQLSFQDFEILREGNESPKVKMLKKVYKDITIHLSISDEKEYAVAFAIAEKN